MDGPRWEILVRIMARLASGDTAALFTLYEEFGTPIAAAVRRHATSMGVALHHDDVQSLVLDACMALMDSAPSWDPDGGALPWNWAERRVRHVVAVHIGIHADSLDERLERGISPSDEAAPDPADLGGDLGAVDDPVRTLDILAEAHPAADEFRLALERVASPRDRRVYLEVTVQRFLGDRAAADTVGTALGLKPATVRQIVKRVRDRLHAAGVAIPALAA